MELGKDIDIDITGLRPGEKLYEELLINEENSTPTRHPKIFSAKEQYLAWEELTIKLDRLFAKASTADKHEILKELKEIVPEFNHNGHLN